MADHELSAAAFAERIGVQRSSISHVMSQRNKPSLDLIMRILEAFPDVKPAWLLHGNDSKPDERFDLPSPSANLPKRDIDYVLVCYTDGTFEKLTPHSSVSADSDS